MIVPPVDSLPLKTVLLISLAIPLFKAQHPVSRNVVVPLIRNICVAVILKLPQP